MKLRVNRQELAEAMGVIGMVASARTPKEILKCVLVRAQSDHLALEATDLEVSLRCVISQVEVEQEGELLVGAEKLGQIARESSDEMLSLEADPSAFHIRGADSHFQVYVQDPKEFPARSGTADDSDFEIATDVLRLISERTVFAAARENTRYAINGVLWEPSPKGLTLVATDGRRLSQARGAIEGDRPREHSAIVPAKVMNLFQRIFTDDDEKVGVRITENQITLRTDRAMISAALVEGHFPKYQEVIPDDNDKTARFKVADLLSAVRRAALLTNEESRGVRFTFGAGELALSSRAPQQGEARITMPVEYDAEPIEIGFNPNFLIDVLRVVHMDEVTLEMKEPTRPGVVRSEGQFLYVLMPVNLS